MCYGRRISQQASHKRPFVKINRRRKTGAKTRRATRGFFRGSWGVGTPGRCQRDRSDARFNNVFPETLKWFGYSRKTLGLFGFEIKTRFLQPSDTAPRTRRSCTASAPCWLQKGKTKNHQRKILRREWNLFWRNSFELKSNHYFTYVAL